MSERGNHKKPITSECEGEKMQTNRNGGHPFFILSQAIAYLLGGMFLCTTSATADMTGTATLIARAFGGLFIAFAFFLVIASFFNRLVAWATRVNMWLFLGLFFVTMTRLIKTALDTTEFRLLYILLAIVFLFLILGALLFQVLRLGTNLGTQLGSRVAAARMLRMMSVTLSLFALAMMITQIDLIGGPILYLTLGLVCLSVASLL